MEYSNLVSISGLSGLFEMVASKTDGAIVKSLEDQTTKFVSSRVHNFSHLESIEVYTVRDNINLVELFQNMLASKEALPSEKDPAQVVAYFKKVYADRSLKIRPSDSFDAPDGFTTDTTGALIPVLVDSLSSDDAIAP